MDLSASTTLPDVEPPELSPAKRRRKPGKKPRTPCTTEGWATTYVTPTMPTRKWVYYHARFPLNQTCLQFVRNGPGDTPERAISQLTKLTRTCTSVLHTTLTTSYDIVFIVDLDKSKQDQLDKILAANKITIAGTSFSYSAELRKLRAIVRDNLEHAKLVTDGLTTTDDSSSDDETAAVAKKPSIPLISLTTKAASQDADLPVPVQPSSSYVESPTSASTSVEQPAPMETSSPPTSESPSPTSASPPPTSALPSQKPDARPRIHGRRRNIYRAVDFAALDVQVQPTTPALTVIFRTVEDQESLHTANPAKLTKELSSFGQYFGLRDIRNGGIAVDFPTETPSEPILALTSLAGIDITASLPASSADSCHAVLSGVHPELTEKEILQNIQTSPPAEVTAVKRLARPGQESWSVKLTFRGTALPERAMLFSRSRTLKTYTDRPLQCHRCGRYGHAERVCRSTQRCFSCGQPHETKECPTPDKPHCSNCGGPHPASSTACAARAFQQKVCQVRAASQVPYRDAKIAVSKAAKTYSAALKGPQDAPKPATSQTTAQSLPPQPTAAATNLTILTLFQGLLTILAKTVPCGSYASLATEVTNLFKSLAPDVTFT